MLTVGSTNIMVFSISGTKNTNISVNPRCKSELLSFFLLNIALQLPIRLLHLLLPLYIFLEELLGPLRCHFSTLGIAIGSVAL